MEPFVIATGTMDYAQNTFIRIHTDTAIYGVGECSAFPMIVGETQDTCLVLARDFAQIWKGKDPLAISERLAELDLYIAGNRTIKSAFDMALHDLAAKHAGLPLYKYLKGSRREITTDITLGIAGPEEMALKARRLQDEGAVMLKVKLGKDPSTDVARIREIRKAVGFEMPIRIDANQGWSYEDALEALKGLEPFKIQFCEQPTHCFHSLDQKRLSHLWPTNRCTRIMMPNVSAKPMPVITSILSFQNLAGYRKL